MNDSFSPDTQKDGEHGASEGLAERSIQGSHDVLAVSEVIALEKDIETQGTSLFELMKRAGGSVSDYVISRFEKASTVAIFCGSGNNGGDGWVIADNLASAGFSVTVITSRSAEQLSAEPARSAALETVSKAPAALEVLVEPTEKQLNALLLNTYVVIDALLGIGFCGSNVKEPYRTWIESINSARQDQSDLHVVAVDIPSGLSADTGKAAGSCIIADATITLLAYKPGLLLDSSRRYCGSLFLANKEYLTR